MKKVLVPTDFSENAKKALFYAIELADRFNSDIMLIHTFVVPHATGSFISIERQIRKDADEAMERLLEEAKAKGNFRVNIKGEILRGSPITTIARTAENYDLVVMGTQGATGMIDTFIGSNASGVIDYSPVPVLVVPKEASYQTLSKIVFAMDQQKVDNMEDIAIVKKLAHEYRALLSLYHIDAATEDIGIDPYVISYFDGIDKDLYTEVTRKDLNIQIAEFVERTQSDLLIMLRRSRGFFEGLFHKSVTKKEVFDSKVPVLILKES